MDTLAKLQNARDLVAHLEAGDEDKADELLDLMARSKEASLFMDVGRLTRELHEALKNLQVDGKLVGLAEQEIPDAKQRLTFVIQKTEEAANRTLSAVETLLPISEKLGDAARSFASDWSRFTRREMDMQEFKVLSGRLTLFLEQIKADSATLHSSLSEVLMAQDFQDLTGQVIRRVITMVTEVESNLVRLIRCAGPGAGKTAESGTALQAEGPEVKGTAGTGQRVNGQDEVDDLLSSLGF
ncbi:MAG: Protein phosphatase CheZ [Gammaproteobacteria bacterium]|nr:Protein phosphatase CheZ [Gammaproteobacteria bacterium]